MTRSKDTAYGLSQAELNRLATYNAETHRGLVHTEAWRAQMADLQRRFDETRLATLAGRKSA